MKLYHFTAAHHVEGGAGHPGVGIRNIGLLPNAHPLISLGPMVWLTKDPSWQQMWSPRPIPGLDCDRTETRITLVIQPEYSARLLTIERVLPLVRADWREDFTGGLDVSAWRSFLGHIPWAWIKRVDYRPATSSSKSEAA